MKRLIRLVKSNWVISIPIGGIILTALGSVIVALLIQFHVIDIEPTLIGVWGLNSLCVFFGLGMILILRENVKKFGRYPPLDNPRNTRLKE